MAEASPSDRLQAAPAASERCSVRERDLPAHVTVYYVIALPGAGHACVLPCGSGQPARAPTMIAQPLTSAHPARTVDTDVRGPNFVQREGAQPPRASFSNRAGDGES